MLVLSGVLWVRWAELRPRCCTSILVWDDWQTGCYAVRECVCVCVALKNAWKMYVIFMTVHKVKVCLTLKKVVSGKFRFIPLSQRSLWSYCPCPSRWLVQSRQIFVPYGLLICFGCSDLWIYATIVQALAVCRLTCLLHRPLQTLLAQQKCVLVLWSPQ